MVDEENFFPSSLSTEQKLSYLKIALLESEIEWLQKEYEQEYPSYLNETEHSQIKQLIPHYSAHPRSESLI